MTRLIFIFCFIFLFIKPVYSQSENSNGLLYTHDFSDKLNYIEYKVNSKQFNTNKLELYKTYNIGINTFEINTETNENVTLVFANDIIIKINQNSEFRVDGFNLLLKNTNTYPSKITVDSYNINLALMNGDAYFSVLNCNTNSQIILQTPVSNLGLDKGKYYIQSTKKSVLICILDGTLDVYDNITNKKEVIKSGNAVLIHSTIYASPKQMEMFEDKMSTVIKKAKPEQFKQYIDTINELDTTRDKVIFISVYNKIVGVKIK